MPWPVHPTGFFGAQGDNDTYKIERSLRFNSADGPYLTRPFSTPTNSSKWTMSMWVKRGNISTYYGLFGKTINSSANQTFAFDSNNSLAWQFSNTTQIVTTQVFRDPSAWYHIVAVWDSANATASQRARIYVNGQEITSFSTDNRSSVTTSMDAWNVNNTTFLHAVGAISATASTVTNNFDGYLTEINFIDGQALTPSSFGETDAITGRWKAKAYSGTYGTNGFYLKFADNSGTTDTTLGKDSSGNGNNWTPNNFSVTAGAGNDSLLDSPTNSGTSGNYATLVGTNSVASNIFSYANGNLDLTQNAATPTATSKVQSTIKIVDKTYFEVTLRSTPSTYDGAGIGVFNETNPYWGAAGSWFYTSNGDFYYNGSYATSWGSSFTNGDILGCAVDPASGKIWFSKNGVWQASGNPSSGSNPAATSISSDGVFAGYVATPLGSYGSGSVSYNFGQRPFAYTAPSGFKALCTTNLPTPTIKKPSSYMDVVTYTGNGSALTPTSSLGFSPDLVWIKGRSGATDHALYDAVRGAEKRLESNNTDAEVTSDGGVTAFNSNGFTLGTLAQVNTNTSTYVAWAWDEAPIAGMDIVAYTGNGAARTIAHNLGVAPKMMIVKNRNKVSDWGVYHIGLTSASYYVYLQSTNAQNLATSMWNGTAPTSSVFSVESSANVNQSNDPYIAYLFAEVEGFSKFGKYSGNSSTDGPFIWCGFRPRWLMIKNITASDVYSSWLILDTQRDTYNTSVNTLWANMSSSEGVRGNGSGSGSSIPIDILSNGFKPRNSGSESNSSGSDFIFAAFAESPFKYARAR